jgi:hypothetical protein
LGNKIEKNEISGLCSTYWGRRGVYRGNLRERDHLEAPGVDRSIILRWIFRKWDLRAWTGSSWLRIGIGVGRV